jgi:hypothetical protein
LHTFSILCYNPNVSLIKKLSFAKATAERRKIKMLVLNVLKDNLLLFFSALIKSTNITLTQILDRVISGEQSLIVGALIGLDLAFTWLLFRISQDFFINLKLLNWIGELKRVGSKKFPHNFDLPSNEQINLIQKKQREAGGHFFLNPKYSSLLIAAFILCATFSYNLPEKYQLVNLIDSNASKNTTKANQNSANQDAMNRVSTEDQSTPTAILGEEANNQNNTSTDALQCLPTGQAGVSTGCANLYQLLAINQDRRGSASSLLGGMLLTKNGELFIVSHSVVSGSIRRSRGIIANTNYSKKCIFRRMGNYA